ncbi:hypothetical protein [Hungatella hathewayi]|uniref:hypothetical protein n=1 Tax=Hungatella hathewayi TaxID=154046 RepID=UPI0035635C14
MKNFIPAARTDRFREMKAYEEKGYQIQNKNNYIKIDELNIIYMKKQYVFGVEITKNEIYFYINRDLANIYLSITEIYELLRNFDNGTIVNAMKKQLLVKKNNDIFYYKDIGYKLPQMVALELERKILISQSGMEITYSELFILINLIQEKSSVLFRRSTVANKKFANGIFRLLIVLCEKEGYISKLSELGWEWDDTDRRFILETIENRDGRNRYKYYLTNDEYKTIMGIKKS